MKRFFLLLCAVCMVQSASAQSALDDLPLGNAAAFGDKTHIIATTRLAPGDDAQDYANQLAARHGLEVVAVWPLASIDVTCLVFSVERDASGAARGIVADGDAILAYPINPFTTDAVRATPDYDDHLLAVQDSLRTMRILPVHAYTTGAGVKVALIDSGVSLSHPDLADQNVEARDFVSGETTGSDGERHGTAMAAIIAADARNDFGMIGVAPDAELWAFRACWEDDATGVGRCNTFSLARALNFAILNDVRIINLSVVGPSDAILRDLIAAAVKRDISVVAALPESSGSGLVDGIAGVILVGDAPSEDRHIFAPGMEVLSAKPGDDFDFYSGESVSTAHVAGAVALIRSRHPELDPGQLDDALFDASEFGKAQLDLCSVFERLGDRLATCE